MTKIKVETLEDLWNLSRIIQPNDVIGAKTIRTKQTSDKGEKRPVYLTLTAEKIHFDDEGVILRVSGKIKDGPDDIEFGYHTIAINLFDVVDIWKKWTSADVTLLKESLSYKGLQVLVCVVDERRADFAIANDLGIKEFASIIAKNKGKQFSKKDDDSFYKQVIEILLEKKDNFEKIILAGPGFTKENIYNTLSKELKQKVSVGSTSVCGKTGINEVIKRGELTKVLKQSRLEEETMLFEKFLEHLGKDDKLSTYGKVQVYDAIVAGAVDMLLVSDKLIRDAKIGQLMKRCEDGGGTVHIINSTHDAGEKLYNMGGIAAILRYALDD